MWTPTTVYQMITSLAGVAVVIYLLITGVDTASALASATIIAQVAGNIKSLSQPSASP